MKQFETGCDAKAHGANAKNHSSLTDNEVAEIIIGCAAKVHKTLGPGLSKSAYEECMGYALSRTVLDIERRKQVPLIADDTKMDGGYKMDFIANKKVILEIKSTDGHHDNHLSKIHTCLRLSGCKAGLLIDFNAENLTKGIKRVVNNNYRCRSLRVAQRELG